MEKHLNDHSLEVFLTRNQVEKHLSLEVSLMRFQMEKHLKDLSLEVSLTRTRMEKHLKDHSHLRCLNEDPNEEAPEGPVTRGVLMRTETDKQLAREQRTSLSGPGKPEKSRGRTTTKKKKKTEFGEFWRRTQKTRERIRTALRRSSSW